MKVEKSKAKALKQSLEGKMSKAFYQQINLINRLNPDLELIQPALTADSC